MVSEVSSLPTLPVSASLALKAQAFAFCSCRRLHSTACHGQLLHAPIAGISAHSWPACIDHSSDIVHTSSGRCQGYPYNLPE